MGTITGKLIIGASAVALMASSACVGEMDDNPGGHDGQLGSSSGTGGDLGFDTPGDGSGGGVCAMVDVTFEQMVPTVVLLIDQSGSMAESFGGGFTRWAAVKHALVDPVEGVVGKLDGEMRFGVTLYTSNGGNQGGICPMLTEVAPAMDNYGAIKALLDSSSPEKDTPTAESVAAAAGALGQIQEPGSKVIVLATDGMPDTCADPHSPNQTAPSIAAVSAAYADGIDTYVIGVGDGVTSAHLQDLAEVGVGQPGAPYYQALDPQSLLDDFNQIVQGVQDCVFAIDGEIDLALACQGHVYLDGNELGCNDPDGWKLNSPSELELTGAACQAIQEGAHTVEGLFPCEVYTPPPR